MCVCVCVPPYEKIRLLIKCMVIVNTRVISTSEYISSKTCLRRYIMA